MTRDEAIEAIETLKEQGETDQDIMSTFYRMFADDKLTLKEFSNLLNLLGYELSEEKTMGYSAISSHHIKCIFY